jgi:hypothetical protein
MAKEGNIPGGKPLFSSWYTQGKDQVSTIGTLLNWRSFYRQHNLG